MADNIQATPRNYIGGLLTDAYKWMQSPQRTQQLQGFAGLLGTTGIPQTIERMAYGEPLTNIGRANVPLLKPETADALMTVSGIAPELKAAAKMLPKNIPVGMGIKPVVYPQEEALKLAQQRAALPVEKGGLGLPANNTAADRAAAMGAKDAVHFSRTGGDFEVLDSGNYAVAPFDAVGTHVGTPEAALDRFRNTVGTTDSIKGSTYPVQVLGDKPLMNPQGLPWGEDELNAFLRKTGGHNWSDVNGGNMTYQDLNTNLRKKLFEDQGYTSIPYVNDVEAKGQVSYIVPPENLRSRFAAFDPFRRNAAIAAAMGVAAPNLLAEELPPQRGLLAP